MYDLVLLQDFITEAGEHLEELESDLLQLENDSENPEYINGIFRSVHSIKGAAQYVGLERISDLSHRMETLLDMVRNHETELTPEIVDTLIGAKDRLSDLTRELEQVQREQSDIAALCRALDAIIDPGAAPPGISEHAEAAGSGHSASDELDTLRAMIQGDAFAEEQDTELLDIFTGQLREKMGVLSAIPQAAASTAEKDQFLNAAAEALRALRSAANYMGYDALLAFYDRWLTAIDQAVGGADLGEASALSFFSNYLTVISETFPAAATATDATEAAPEPDSAADEPADELALALDGLEPSDEEESSAADELAQALGDLGGGDAEVEAPSAPAVSAAPPAPVASAPKKPILDTGDADTADPVYQEDLDGELFDIFINHAIDGLGALDEERQRWHNEGCSTEGFAQSVDILKSLQSSANYMGYDDLRALYLEWADQIAAAGEQLHAGEPVGLDFWDDCRGRLLHKLPQLAERIKTLGAAGKPAVANAPAPAVEVSSPDDPDLQLFDMLNHAFNATVSAMPNEVETPLLEVIDELMTGQSLLPWPDFMGAEAAVLSDPGMSPEAHTPPSAVVGEGATAAAESAPVSDPQQAATPDASEAPPEMETRTAASDAAPATEQSSEKPVKTKKMKQSFRVDADKIDYLMNQVGELVVSRAFFTQLYNDLRTLHQELKENLGLSQKQLKPVREFSFRLGEATVALGRVSNELQEGVMKARMLPISQLFSRYPRLARDLVHKTDKQVSLQVRGEDTELDKMIIEAISDPLIHIIRNAIDHGIETVTDRRRLGKPETATLTLNAFHESNHIVIEVTDDGRGIDLARIRKKALEGGFGNEEDIKRLSDRDLMRLIMVPGFSTADHATRTSGRGVGMDVVKKNIERLNGSIEIESIPGKMTTIRVKIPLTLAIITALLVRVGEDLFTIPLSAVDETIRVFESDITTIDCVEVIHLRDVTTPILRLSELFNLPAVERHDGKHFIVIVKAGSQHVGLVVDALIGQEEVVIKPLPDYLRERSGFSGATIIGDGEISLILDIYELVNVATSRQIQRRQRSPRGAHASASMHAEAAAPTIH